MAVAPEKPVGQQRDRRARWQSGQGKTAATWPTSRYRSNGFLTTITGTTRRGVDHADREDAVRTVPGAARGGGTPRGRVVRRNLPRLGTTPRRAGHRARGVNAT